MSIDTILKLLNARPPTAEGLAKAYGMAIGMGFRSKDLQMALDNVRGGDMELAAKYLYGPTPFGNGDGAIAYFKKIQQIKG